jgi:hypothetical protein
MDYLLPVIIYLRIVLDKMRSKVGAAPMARLKRRGLRAVHLSTLVLPLIRFSNTYSNSLAVAYFY